MAYTNTLMPSLQLVAQFLQNKAKKKVYGGIAQGLNEKIQSVDTIQKLSTVMQDSMKNIYGEDYLDPQEQAQLVGIAGQYGQTQQSKIQMDQQQRIALDMLDLSKKANADAQFIFNGRLISNEDVFSNLDKIQNPVDKLQAYQVMTQRRTSDKAAVSFIEGQYNLTRAQVDPITGREFDTKTTPVIRTTKSGELYRDMNKNKVVDEGDIPLTPTEVDLYMREHGIQQQRTEQKAERKEDIIGIGHVGFVAQQDIYKREDYLGTGIDRKPKEGAIPIHKLGEPISLLQTRYRDHVKYTGIGGEPLEFDIKQGEVITELSESRRIQGLSKQITIKNYELKQLGKEAYNKLSMLVNSNKMPAVTEQYMMFLKDANTIGSSDGLNAVINNLNNIKSQTKPDTDEYKILRTYIEKELKPIKIKMEEREEQLAHLGGQIERTDADIKNEEQLYDIKTRSKIQQYIDPQEDLGYLKQYK